MWWWAWLTVGHSLQMVSNHHSKPTLPPEPAHHIPLGPPKALVEVWVPLYAPVHLLPQGHHTEAQDTPPPLGACEAWWKRLSQRHQFFILNIEMLGLLHMKSSLVTDSLQLLRPYHGLPRPH